MNNEQNLGNILESLTTNALQTNVKVNKMVQAIVAQHNTTGKLVEYTNRCERVFKTHRKNIKMLAVATLITTGMAYITAKRVDYLENKIERLQKELNESKRTK
jgi:hypothetical protein